MESVVILELKNHAMSSDKRDWNHNSAGVFNASVTNDAQITIKTGSLLAAVSNLFSQVKRWTLFQGFSVQYAKLLTAILQVGYRSPGCNWLYYRDWKLRKKKFPVEASPPPNKRKKSAPSRFGEDIAENIKRYKHSYFQSQSLVLKASYFEITDTLSANSDFWSLIGLSSNLYIPFAGAKDKMPFWQGRINFQKYLQRPSQHWSYCRENQVS